MYLRAVKDDRGFSVEERSPGIYTVIGDIMPIQVIDSRRLSVAENLWLKSLSNRLGPKEYLQVNTKAYRQGKDARVGAYMNVIALANFHVVEEAINMSSEAKSLDEVLERTGIAARWEERKALAIAQNMVNMGLLMETIVSATSLDPEKVNELYRGAVNK